MRMYANLYVHVYDGECVMIVKATLYECKGNSDHHMNIGMHKKITKYKLYYS
jgi:hypothetical protein